MTLRLLQGALVFVVGVVFAGLVGRAVGGAVAPLVGMTVGFPFGVLAAALATRP